MGVPKEVCVLEKERALLRKEDFESLINCVLRLIGFDLGEIRIYGRIEYQAVVKDELRVETGLTPRVYLIKTRLGWVARINGAEVAERSVGNELHVVAGRDVLQAADRAFLVQDTGDTARHIWPVRDPLAVGGGAHEKGHPEVTHRW